MTLMNAGHISDYELTRGSLYLTITVVFVSILHRNNVGMKRIYCKYKSQQFCDYSGDKLMRYKEVIQQSWNVCVFIGMHCNH